MSEAPPDTSATDLRVVPLSDVPVHEILQLVRRSLGTGRVPRSEDFWAWKHLRGPFGASPGLAALDARGRVVGLRAFMPWRWRADGHSWRAVRAVDTATDPAWRRRGIFRRLTIESVERLRDDGVAFIFNTPNRVSLAGYLSMGWKEVGPLPLLVRPLFGRRRLSADRFLEPAQTALTDPGHLTSVCRLGTAMGRLETPLDATFLAWRYAAPPGLDYRVCRFRNEGATSLVVCRLRKRGRLRELGVADVLASPGEAGVALAGKALRHVLAQAPACYAVASAPPGTADRRLLLRGGLLPVPHRGPRLVVRRLTDDPALPNLTRWDTWRTVLGDLELF